MIERNLEEVDWVCTYDAENHLVEVEKDGVTENRYYYDGDGNRVARLGADNKGTIFIGKYFEAAYPQIDIPEPPPPITEGCELGDEGCQGNLEGGNTPYAVPGLGKYGDSYYYAGSQRIAMRTGQGAYLLFSDHLGSTSIVMDASGQVVEEGYYMPWGGERGDQGISTTDYGYTGQMREGDIYYYGARWYDPAIGRFMQADTIVPPTQGTQTFDHHLDLGIADTRHLNEFIETSLQKP